MKPMMDKDFEVHHHAHILKEHAKMTPAQKRAAAAHIKKEIVVAQKAVKQK
jgi:hypothetical protein